ncbi:hypothetical protein, unknown function [Leishmania tarentolae]|uniref:Uncharacterized protein n=1 Tax=Leishmania tarentolae TaxID=5689 RepID=A0A640KUD4_LEITA|nr:hypothetical protein, unknown function [Leishmania tarentolae]
MLGGPTRRLHVLWGQTLASYVPPHSSSGLVRGHLLRRYPVSGAASAPSPAQKSDAEVEAHVTTAAWLPARTPAEVVLNANEFSTFHAVPTVSPEDVRWCTHYLLATSSLPPTAPAGVASPKRQDRDVTIATVTRHFRDPVNCSLETPVGRADNAYRPFDSIIANLNSLRHILCEHRCLLAGAESLQTGVPISCILAEHNEAQLYLTWSLASHQSRPLPQEVLLTPSDRVCYDGHNNDLCVSAGSRDAIAPLTDGCMSAVDKASGGAKSIATPHPRLGQGESEKRERLERLRHRFQREVAHLHSRGQRGTAPEAFQGIMPINAEGAQAKPFLSMAGPRISLLAVMTSAGNGLAAAIKAAAVAWACGACEVRGRGTSSLRCGVYAADILWRPAPATSLVATWWTALLHQHQKACRTANSADSARVSSCDAPVQFSLKRDPLTLAGSATELHEGYQSASGKRGKEMNTGVVPSLAPWMHNFHVLITGGDTANHFILPLMAGVDDGIARTHRQNANRSERMDVSAQGGDRGDGAASGQCGSATACALSSVPSACRRNPEALAMLLCYGCPAAQVEHVHAIHHSYVAQQDRANALLTAELGGVLGTQSYTNVISDGKDTAATSEQNTNLPWMRPAACATTGLVELSTETPAVSMVTALPPASSAATPSSMAASSLLSLSYGLRGASLSLAPSSAVHPVLLNVGAAAQPMSLKEVAACVFESSFLERPLRHAGLRHHCLEACVGASQTSLHEPQPVVAPAVLPQGASLHLGWCSLCFAPQTYAPELLSTLVEHHFGQSLRSGHSFDAVCRRGPLPSPPHMQMTQEALRCATRGGCVHRQSPQGGHHRRKHAGAGSFPLRTPALTTSTVAPLCAQESTCTNDDRQNFGVLPEVRWTHVCGGFTLPLTAVKGRSSPYFVPCLLFTDLAEVASMMLKKGREGGQSHVGSETMKVRWPGASVCPEEQKPFLPKACSSGLDPVPQTTLQYSASEESVQTQAQVACAVAAVEDSVFDLKRTHDTETLGYRGVVSGNYLFICCYPDAWQDAVKDALMRQ